MLPQILTKCSIELIVTEQYILQRPWHGTCGNAVDELVVGHVQVSQVVTRPSSRRQGACQGIVIESQNLEMLQGLYDGSWNFSLELIVTKIEFG